MRTLRSRALLATMLLAAAGCGSTQERESEDFYSRNVITAEQIHETRATNAYEAVDRLKSHWLRSTTPTSPYNLEDRTAPVNVYIDNQRVGGVEQLRRVEAAAIEYIQFFPPAEAAARWGFGNAGGAILVATRPAGP